MFVRVGPVVRATSATSVVIWAELAQAGTVELSAQALNEQRGRLITTTAKTVTVGGRHFAAPQLQGLRPGTWYRYHLSSADSKETFFGQTSFILQLFRTFDQNRFKEIPTQQVLRIAYGSCRKASNPTTDVLNGFGNWLAANVEEREQTWPHILLLIGDQIYADDPPPGLVQQHPHLAQGARTFEDFARIYEYSWTYANGVRQALAALPTFMMFDDHEVTNTWNGTPQWLARMVRAGKEQLLIDGLLAYWIYQGWGNLVTRDEEHHPLLRIMRNAERDGNDALEQLRACIKAELYGHIRLSWHYEIPTTPAIFVLNTRTERPAMFANRTDDRNALARIISQEQMQELRSWARMSYDRLLLVASSVPVLLPPVIGLAEAAAGKRLWHKSSGLPRWIGQQIARIQRWLGEKASFDHWPLYEESWHELLHIWQEQQKDLLILSGDVHFSYAIRATYQYTEATRPTLHQSVCTPLQNALSRSDRRKIELQSAIRQSTYGSLRTQILPLQRVQEEASITNDLLFENVLAMVTLHAQMDHTYTVQQEYLGLVQGQLATIAHPLFAEEKKGWQ